MTSEPSKSRLSDADIERLEKLASMRERGILTQQEFDDQKAIIQGAPATPTVAPEAESSAAPLTSTSPTEEATWDRWGKMPITPTAKPKK